jgi:hypothetical protein
MDSVDVMRLPMDICPEAMLEHTENLSDVTPLKDEKRRKTNLQHNKPKKANKMVIPQGSYFICGYYSLRCAALFSDLTILWHTAILYARLCLHFRRYRCCQVNHVCTKKYQVCGHRWCVVIKQWLTMPYARWHVLVRLWKSNCMKTVYLNKYYVYNSKHILCTIL